MKIKTMEVKRIRAESNGKECNFSSFRTKISSIERTYRMVAILTLATVFYTVTGLASVARAKPGEYPMFGGYSTHGNPAEFNSRTLGQWGYVGALSGKDYKEVDLMASADIRKEITATGLLANSTKGNSSSSTTILWLSMPASSGVLMGGKLASTTSGDGSRSNGMGIGVIGTSNPENGNLMLRAGISDNGNSTSVAGEARTQFAGVEVTGSVSATRERSGDISDAGAGIEAKRGPILVAVGAGEGKTEYHLRYMIGNKIFDLNVSPRTHMAELGITLWW